MLAFKGGGRPGELAQAVFLVALLSRVLAHGFTLGLDQVATSLINREILRNGSDRGRHILLRRR